MSRTGMVRTGLIAVAVALASASSASAQRTNVTGGGFRDQTIVDDTLNRRGRIEVGASLAGAISFGSVSSEATDESASQSSLYVTPALVGGYMLTDNIEARLTAGVLLLKTKIGDIETQNSLVFPLTLQGLYQRDFILGLAGYGGIGVGGFFGGRDEPTAMMGVTQRISQSGFLGQVLLGLMAMPGPRLLLRGGLRLDAFFGSESADFDDPMGLYDRSFTNIQIVFEAGIGARFN